MKKFFLIGGLVVVVVVVAVVVTAFLSLNTIVKRSIETVGPMVTKVDVTVGSVDISATSGSGKLDNFVVGVPSGYKSSSTLKVGEVALGVEPKSLMSDVIVINEISVKDAEITLEGSLDDNNISKIQSNVKEFSGTNNAAPAADKTKPAEKKVERKMIINHFLIQGARVNMVLNLPVIGTKTLGGTMPTIELSDLGKSKGGITSDELISEVIGKIYDQIYPMAKAEVEKLLESAGNLKDLGKNLNNDTVNKATDAIGGLFKKKP